MALKSGLNSKRKAAQAVKFCVKQERSAMLKKVYALLKKTEVDRTEEEKQFLLNCIDLVKEVRKRIDRQKKLKERVKEVEDPPDVVAEKCEVLADALSVCRNLIVYTGAGVSTAACIPDYRGSNGIWTLLQQGKDIGLHDLTKAEPTFTHMAISQLHQIGMVKHIVSQNCDGLHLRSGLPREALSELHGNMYIEVCRQCQPVREYWRPFDVTENTARFSHRTGRRCYMCSGPLIDSIVHFGERGTLKWPLNWPAAITAAENADAILCIGSSLKVLKRYPWLWCMDKHPRKRPRLYIVNLQWTPKDVHAVLKINARCDEVIRQVMDLLRIAVPLYDRRRDPIFCHSTLLHIAEMHTTTKPHLLPPEEGWETCSGLKQSKEEEDLALEPVMENQTSCEEPPVSKEVKNEVTGCIYPVKQEEESHCQEVCIKTERASPELDEDYGDISDIGEVVVKTERLSPSPEEEFQLQNYSCDTDLVSDDPLRQATNDESTSEDPLDTELASEDPALDSISSSLEVLSMEIIYEGVKLKVEDNVSVPANVKINNDIAILCDMSSIKCNSFLFNSSYELEETPHSFQCVKSGEVEGQTGSPDEGTRQEQDLPFSPIIDHSYSQSIQNLPILNFRTKNPMINQSTSQSPSPPKESRRKQIKQVPEPPAPTCSYCAVLYKAKKCLFYTPREPVFHNPDAGVCECCSEGSEEEEEEPEKDEETEKNENKDDAASTTVVKPASNPGWYGKGCRKRIKKKR